MLWKCIFVDQEVRLRLILKSNWIVDLYRIQHKIVRTKVWLAMFDFFGTDSETSQHRKIQSYWSNNAQLQFYGFLVPTKDTWYKKCMHGLISVSA